MIKVGIYGASGYTGYELVRILSRHPQVHIAFATSESQAGSDLSAVFPAGPALLLHSATQVDPASVDVVFLALPHAASAKVAELALQAGARVIDLSADFRLSDPTTYADWYGGPHLAPHLLPNAIYGLTEAVRDQLPSAQLVANPGCYPTSILLALWPLAKAGLLPHHAPIIADSKSGASGAGRTPKPHLHFVELADNFMPYSIGHAHRHLPEIEQQLHAWTQPHTPNLIFSPHLLPVPRGLLSTIYVPLSADQTLNDLHQLYAEHYEAEPFVNLLPLGRLPSLAHVVHTNRCVIGLTLAGNTLILTSAIDNLVKGAAGQAVQNFNLMFGLPETTALI